MEENTEVFVITEHSLQDKIYTIRGQKVMLDFELAEIYGYEKKILIDKSRIINKNLRVKILCFNFQMKKLRSFQGAKISP